MKILMTFTGYNDPYSKGMVAGEDQAGPILSVLAARKLDRVVLFSTPSMAESTDATAAAISAMVNGPEVSIRRLDLPDPTDYLAILRELRRECGAIRQQYVEDELFVSTASGTPQMHACWFLLTASGEIPATLLHVRPPRFVTTKLPVVSEIVPSAGEFPKVLPGRMMAPTTDSAALLESAMESVGLVVEHRSMRKVAEKAAHVAETDVTVLILGETGTGKEMFARLIHELSPRRGPFVAVNCGAIPAELVESTLFGHLKGSFTGAVSNQIGKFEQAAGGTLLLDEIGELPLSAQVKLLRVLQEKTIEPVGANGTRKVDVRVIAATNRNLDEERKAKRFREDLYYRLAPITLTIPPLRERRTEIHRIAIYLLERLNRSYRRQRRFAPATLRYLTNYPWRGNVRELEGVISRAVILCETDLIEPQDLDLGVAEATTQLPQPFEGFRLEAFLDETRATMMARALEMANGNQSQAAKLLGMSGQNVSKFLKGRAKT
jgi:transcriptional regulator with AAA-type ATPase domain